MPFPSSPTNNQKYTNSNGTVYKYDSSNNAWIVDRFSSAGSTGMPGMQGAQGATGLGIQGATGLGTAGTGPSSGATGVINLPMDGGGLPITGLICDLKLPNSIRVNSWTIVTAGDTGSMTLGVWRKNYANFPPTSSDAMHTGATGPYILTTDILKRQGTTSGWQGATGAGSDWIRIYVTQSDNQISKATLALDYNII
jgi:hypothetical protein